MTVSICLVGCGGMGSRHVQGFARLLRSGMSNVRLAAVCDVRADNAERVAGEAEALLGYRPKIHLRIEGAIADPEIEAFDVVTEAFSHLSVVLPALAAGKHVLCEKPLALTVRSCRALIDAAHKSGAVLATAENYRRDPTNRLAKAVIDSGAIGEANEVEVSSTHMYHAMGVIRQMLGVGFQGAEIRAIATEHDLATPMTHAGWSADPTPAPAKTVRALIRFEGGKVATYDFTDNQWWNPLRQDRIAVRGSLGEIVDLRVTQLAGPRTFVTSHLVRRHTGIELNLEGNELDHISWGSEVVYTNAWRGSRFADDEIAVSSLLAATGAWVKSDAPPPYPLAEGSQDWALALGVEEAAESGETVLVGRQPWSAA